MKKTAIKFLLSFMCVAAAVPASAQFNLKKAIGGATKAVQAATLTDAQMAEWTRTIPSLPTTIHTPSA